jgi:comEA protein
LISLSVFIVWVTISQLKSIKRNPQTPASALRYALVLFSLLWPLWMYYSTVWMMEITMLLYWGSLGYVMRETLVPEQQTGSKTSFPNIGSDTCSTSSQSQTVFQININTAAKEALMELPGIGETKAQAIIDYRTQNGPFTAIEQIQNVSGIGTATFEKFEVLNDHD